MTSKRRRDNIRKTLYGGDSPSHDDWLLDEFFYKLFDEESDNGREIDDNGREITPLPTRVEQSQVTVDDPVLRGIDFASTNDLLRRAAVAATGISIDFSELENRMVAFSQAMEQEHNRQSDEIAGVIDDWIARALDAERDPPHWNNPLDPTDHWNDAVASLDEAETETEDEAIDVNAQEQKLLLRAIGQYLSESTNDIASDVSIVEDFYGFHTRISLNLRIDHETIERIAGLPSTDNNAEDMLMLAVLKLKDEEQTVYDVLEKVLVNLAEANIGETVHGFLEKLKKNDPAFYNVILHFLAEGAGRTKMKTDVLAEFKRTGADKSKSLTKRAKRRVKVPKPKPTDGKN